MNILLYGEALSTASNYCFYQILCRRRGGMEENMENQEEYIPSREELIRMARESCARNMYPDGMSSREYNSLKYKDNFYDAKMNHKNTVSDRERTKPALAGVKFFLIRLICAGIVFMAVFAMDKMNLKLYSFDSGFVLKCISTNEGLEAAQDYAVSVYESLVKPADKTK